jgi:hypothetical protein
MAAACQINGVMRELWTEIGPQGPGAQIVDTGIAISTAQLSRVQGFLSVSNLAGLPIMMAAPSVVNRHLRITVANFGAPGSTAAWVLDVALLSSTDQGRRAGAGFIMVVNATPGLVGPQTLAQTYAVGAGAYPAADQTMTVLDADGGGIIVDASGPGATVASVIAFEVRQNDLDIPLPFRLARRGNFANPAALVFDRARGTFAAPVDNQAADMMGCIDFYGWVNNAQSAQPGAQIIGVVTSVAAAVLDGALDFYAGLNSVSTQVLRLDVGGTGGIPRGVLYGAGEFVPSANSTGSLGIVGAVWNLVSATDVCVYGNLRMGGAAVGGAATQTVLLPVAGTALPVPQVGQVYLGGATFTGTTGQGDAALAISSEELAIPVGIAVATHLIPVMFNGNAYYLLAADDEPQA